MNIQTIQLKNRIYIAAPLFSESELKYNAYLKKLLLPYFSVYLPQEDGELIVNLTKQGVSPLVASERIFKSDVSEIQKCEYLLIILDGRSIDEGAAFELGHAYALGKKCIGLQTDVRRLLPIGNNPMIECAISQTFESTDELTAWAKSCCKMTPSSGKEKDDLLCEY